MEEGEDGEEVEMERCYLEIRIKAQDGLYHIAEKSQGFRWFFV